MDIKQLEEALRRASGSLPEEDHKLFSDIASSYLYLCEVLGDKDASLAKLRKQLFGSRSERYRDVVGDDDEAGDREDAEPSEPQDTEPPAATASTDDNKPPPPGHGRNGADDFPGAQHVDVNHDCHQPGDRCPECDQGTLYEKPAGILLRFVGQAPVDCTVYHLQKLRCHVCGRTFTAAAPPEAAEGKYDETAVSMIALLKYGSGLPFNRLARLQGHQGIPLAASTQWDVLSSQWLSFLPAYTELIRQAAQGDIVYSDDTKVRILELMGVNRQEALQNECEDARSGLFTTGVISTCADFRAALFFSGWKHAGENLSEVLLQRAEQLDSPLHMCDALSRNVLPEDLAVILSHCLSHARRNFVDIYASFTEECKQILKAFKEIYRNDATTRKKEMSPAERLAYHQLHSAPVMEGLQTWLQEQIDEKYVEPNSQLGQAINYMLKRWETFTVFLREEGAPLDNNICERALKKAIIHRKNSLFYKTRRGAALGDMFMSLIYTCELMRVNPFEYLNELQRNANEVDAEPSAWMPWNYQDALATTEAEAMA